MPRPKFPHFSQAEAEVMDEFIKQGVLKGKYSFDVKLPSIKSSVAKISSPSLKYMWENLTAKKIDGFCERDADLNIIEVKRVMLPSGIGQLFLYKYMYEIYKKPTKPIRLWLIARYPDPDIIAYCKTHGIFTWTIEEL